MSASVSAREGTFFDEKAVWLKAGQYEAAVLPEIGGNLIAFRDVEKAYRFLREPEDENDWKAFREKPAVWGIPVLFPPNRFEDGKFPWKGKTYTFPVNEPDKGNHLHGFLYDIPWTVEKYGADENESDVVLVQKVDEDHPVYRHFPHSFLFRLRYTLNRDGLHQHVMIKNTGAETMPCLLAFHTAVRAPFAAGSTARDCKVKLTIGKRWEVNERMLPTGNEQPLSQEEERLKTEGIYPFYEEMDNHYTSAPQNGRNRMELTDTKNRVTLVYDAGTSYKHWMLWNNFATEGFSAPSRRST